MVLDLRWSSHIVCSTDYLHPRILDLIYICHKWLRMKTRSTVQLAGFRTAKWEFRANSRAHCVVSAGRGQALRCALAAGVDWGDSGGTEVAAANQTGDGESQNAGFEGPRPVHPESWQLRWILTKGAFISSTVFSSLCWTYRFMLSWSYECVFLLMIDARLSYTFGHMYTVL